MDRVSLKAEFIDDEMFAGWFLAFIVDIDRDEESNGAFWAMT